MAEESVLKNKFKQGYAAVFYEQWPALTSSHLDYRKDPWGKD